MGGFLQVSGLKYTIDTTVKSSAKGDDKSMFVSVDGAYRVKNVKVLKNGKYVDIDPKATYTVASHNYMLKDSGDGINMFADNKLLQDSVMLDNQVLINYIKDSLGGVVPATYAAPQGRITVIATPYTDVLDGNWAVEAVNYVTDKNFMKGSERDDLRPERCADARYAVTVGPVPHGRLSRGDRQGQREVLRLHRRQLVCRRRSVGKRERHRQRL